MSTKDAILGHVCVERGWMSEPQMEECLREHDELPRVLLRRHLIPEMELEALRQEIDKVLKADPSSEDLRLLKLLLKSNQVSKAHVDAAMTEQRELLGKGSHVRVIEILLEKGHLTLAALEDTLHALRTAATAVVSQSCKASYSILSYDAGRIYLCKTCTGELAPAAAAAPSSSTASSAILPSVGETGLPLGRHSPPNE